MVWFNALETATALGYKTPKDTIKKRVDKDEKIQLGKIEVNGTSLDAHVAGVEI